MTNIRMLTLFFCGLGSPLALAQQDNFNDGNDTGWTRFNPLGNCTFTFPSGGYRLSAAPSPDPVNFGPGRGGSLRQDAVFDRFVLCVDIIDWNPGEDASLGFLARVQANPGPGNINGYALTIQTQDLDMGIEKVTGEQPANLSGYSAITLLPGHDYRLVFTGAGPHLEGHLFDIADLSKPIASVFADDASYARGTGGLIVFSDENSPASGTFDNYSATEGARQPLDDFNDGNDTGWTRYNPLGVASFSFPAGGYTVASAPSPDIAFGPARAAALRTGQVLADFCVECDIVGFNPAEDSAIGLLARVATPGLGTTSGYSLTYQAQDQGLEINRIAGEQPTRINPAEVSVVLDPTRRYRMTFAGVGGKFEGRIIDTAFPATPVATIYATDGTYTSGLAGLVVFSDGNTATSATFDSYHAGVPELPVLQITKAGSLARLWWDHGASLCHHLETSTDLEVWVPLESGATVAGKTATLEYLPDASGRFFRFKIGQ